MPNYNALVYTAADFKIILLIDGIPFPLLTLQDFGSSIKKEEETIYAIGEIDPIAEKSTGKGYSGKVSIEAGELTRILLATGLTDATDIQGAQLGITSKDGFYHRVYSGVNINSEDTDFKVKDRHIPVPLTWKAISVK